MVRKILWMWLLIIGLAACTSEENEDTGVQIIVEYDEITEGVTESGGWNVASFMDSGTDETNHFAGYSFEFDENGTVTATKGSNVVNGTWEILLNDETPDTYDDLVFHLSFSGSQAFQDISDNWLLLSYSEEEIQLFNNTGGSTDYLTFENM